MWKFMKLAKINAETITANRADDLMIDAETITANRADDLMIDAETITANSADDLMIDAETITANSADDLMIDAETITADKFEDLVIDAETITASQPEDIIEFKGIGDGAAQRGGGDDYIHFNDELTILAEEGTDTLLLKGGDDAETINVSEPTDYLFDPDNFGATPPLDISYELADLNEMGQTPIDAMTYTLE